MQSQLASLELQPALPTEPADNPMGDAIDAVDALRDRAIVIIREGHDPTAILQSALADLRGIGSLSGMVGVLQTGRFTPQQKALAERLAVKVIAYSALTKGA